MLTRFHFGILLYLASLIAFGQQDSYKIYLDLRHSENDQLKVTLKVPRISEDSVEFHLPKIVPGTYSISDFGRFASNLEAFDSLGEPLEVSSLDVNRWIIANSTRLDYITYLVDDTFDKNENYQSNMIFEPGGTSFEAERGVYVLNPFGFIGYIDGYKFNPFELIIKHDEKHYGATSLTRNKRDKVTDVFTAENYNFLADGPIMYCEPDTTVKRIDGAEITVSLYSPNGKMSSAEVMDNLNDLIEAQTEYLGGKLPVNRYTYLIYLLDYSPASGGMGALEHSYSSLYTLPEARAGRIGQIVRDVAAHEFLHIVTPLNIHSEQIHEFNYIKPDMSKHLWLYEGVTEYSAMHVQVRSGLFDERTFLDQVKEKLQKAARFPDVSFTEMSEKILDPEFEPMYVNVYYKGALIGMCLDLLLIHHSDGKIDLPSFLAELSEKYGPMQAFEDDGLIDEITEMTYPEIGDFFQQYVIGNAPLPIAEILQLAGYDYVDGGKVETPTLGNISFSMNDESQIIVEGIDKMNDFGMEMGYEPGDVLVSVNGMKLTLENVQQVLEEFQNTVQDGDKIKVEVLREVADKQKTLKLKAKAKLIEVEQPADIIASKTSSKTQRQTKEIWLKGFQ
ncbi:MAG: peptidase M61 [Cyclobacteriaceae bacterium]